MAAILTKLPDMLKSGVTSENIINSIDEALGLLKAEESDSLPEEMNEFLKEFSLLIKDAGFKKFIVVIDDLDRCLPKTSIETMEAIRLFLFVPKTVFVIAADEKMIEYAVNRHQIPFRLPSLGYTETRQIKRFLNSMQLKEKEFQKKDRTSSN